jgi:PAS domain S-box-containing protein
MVKNSDKSPAQKTAETKVDTVRDLLGPFVRAVEKTRMAMVFTDAKTPDERIIYANDSFLELCGFERDEVLGESIDALLARGAVPGTWKNLKSSFANSARETTADPEIKYRCKDGSEFWASVFVSPVPDAGGNIIQHFVSFVDITRHKNAVATARLLIEELNHRVKNTLATVMSIIDQTFRRSSDVSEIRDLVFARVSALSRSHDLLNSTNWEDTGLHDIVDAALEPFLVSNDDVKRIVIQGENLSVSPKVTLSLGIALHELATNAVKYGALSNETGTVSVTWARDHNRLNLRWQEEHGPRVKPPSHTGFGSQIIERGLALELQGTVKLNYLADGVVCTISMPVEGGSRGS